MATTGGRQLLRGLARGKAGLVLAALLIGTAFGQGLPPSRAGLRPLTTAPDGRALRLTFSDEFDSFRPFDGKAGIWRTTYGAGGTVTLDHRTLRNNEEAQIYVDRSLGVDPFVLRNGVLVIEARPATPEVSRRIDGFRYTSGVITTQPSFSQRYGYFEMRARLPSGKGLWPAFWMLPADMSWPPEIDVMESIGDARQVFMTTHSGVQPSKGIDTRIEGGVFHTFAVSWDPKNVIWYIDGREAQRQPTPGDMHKPMFLVANLAVGGKWPGMPDAGTRFPATMEIDAIRAYQFAP